MRSAFQRRGRRESYPTSRTLIGTLALFSFLLAGHCGAQTGLVLWLKADTGVTYDGSNNVSAWADQSGGGNDVIQATGGNKPLYVATDINGKPALRFNGSQWLFSSNNLGLNADMTTVVVGSTSDFSLNEYCVDLGGTTFGSARGQGYYAYMQIAVFAGTYCQGAIVPNMNTFVVETASLASTMTDITFYRNGTQTATATVSGLTNMSAGITVGAYNGGASNGWQGDVAEVLVYNHKLNSTDLQTVGVYVADKYGLYNPNATWPSSYSAAVQTAIARNKWNKSQADNYVAMQSANPNVMTNGLVVWLKADNGVTYGGSSNVSAWADQTGNYTITQPTGAYQPTYISSDVNGKPGVRFNGSEWMHTIDNLYLNNDLTMFVVGSTSSTGAEQYSVHLGDIVAGTSRAMGYAGSLQATAYYGTSCLGAAVPPASTFVAEANTLASNLTDVAFFRNGVRTATSTVSGLQNTWFGISLGTFYDLGHQWVGDIAEVMIFDHQLSGADMDQVSVYLADKYNVGVSLPAVTITTALASSGWGTTVSFSSVPYPAQIRYTLDGSTPTSSSTLYTGPFTVTASSMVNATVFLNGVQISPVAFAPALVPNPPPSSGSGTPATINLIKPANAVLIP